jgi:hypothetical protein
MKYLAVVIIAVLLAGSASARLGETKEQAELRYGNPNREATCNGIEGTVPKGGFREYYKKDDIEISAIFFPNAAGTLVIGYIKYSFKEISDTKAALPVLLKSNSDGEKWKEESHQQYRRNNAVSWMGSFDIYFRSAAYDAYVEKIGNDANNVSGAKTRKSLQGL